MSDTATGFAALFRIEDGAEIEFGTREPCRYRVDRHGRYRGILRAITMPVPQAGRVLARVMDEPAEGSVVAETQPERFPCSGTYTITH